MAAEDHPLYRTWTEALERLVEAERRYHIARMEGRPEGEVHPVARDLDVAREAYRSIADQVDQAAE